MQRVKVGDVIEYEGYLGLVIGFTKYKCPMVDWLLAIHPEWNYREDHPDADWYVHPEAIAKFKHIYTLKRK